MSGNESVCKDLEEFLVQHLPLVKAAGISIDQYDGESLLVSAPLDKNINDKGTAFGGSLYVVCVAAGWGMTFLKSQEFGMEGELVVAKGEIDYLSPLKGRLVATAKEPSGELLEKFRQRYEARGKAAMPVEVTVDNEKGEPCIRFVGKYAIVRDV